MNRKLIIEGNAVYEVDEDCRLKKRLRDEEEKMSAGEDICKDAYMEEYKKACRRAE